MSPNNRTGHNQEELAGFGTRDTLQVRCFWPQQHLPAQTTRGTLKLGFLGAQRCHLQLCQPTGLPCQSPQTTTALEKASQQAGLAGNLVMFVFILLFLRND